MLKLNKNGNIIDFQEKPRSSNYKYASLGIYLFNREYLIKSLDNGPCDLVFDIFIPNVKEGMVSGYEFKSFWQDIGSLSSYYRTSMKLLKNHSFMLDKELPMLTRSAGLPPTRFASSCSVNNSIIADGCKIEGKVKNSIVFPGVHISNDTFVENSIIFPFSKVNRKAVIKKAIIDKIVIVEEGALVGNCSGKHGPRAITIVGKGCKISKDIRIIEGSKIEPGCVILEDLT
jgi:glucose-1-phosphate adenylyltransferase